MNLKEKIRINNITFYLNDKKINIDVLPETTLLQVLHEHLSLTGTKESCSEGDCGACTVALGEIINNKLIYKSINSCLHPATKVHGKHIVTIEGLEENGILHIIQEKILENHATQCGYCTPGIIMSLFALFANNYIPDKNQIISALEGNLCRCTGYESIRKTGIQLSEHIKKNIDIKDNIIFPSYYKKIEQELLSFNNAINSYFIQNNEDREVLEYYLPKNLDELYEIFDNYDFTNSVKIINGGTDIIVAMNIKREFSSYYIDISNINEIKFIEKRGDNIVIGGGVTLRYAAENPLINQYLPIIKTAINQMASCQIRNVATLSGNIANASPIGDIAVLLLALNAKLVMFSKNHKREILLKDFYKDYKLTDIKTNEIIGEIIIPLQKNSYHFFEKTSKRVAVDISTVNSAVNFIIEDNIIKTCTIAFGGVYKYPHRAYKTEEFLKNKSIKDLSIEEALEILLNEYFPISDVRGSANYRKQLIKNHFIRHFNNIISELNKN